MTLKGHDSNVWSLYLELWGRGILSPSSCSQTTEGSCVSPTSIHKSLNHSKIQKIPSSCAAEPEAVVTEKKTAGIPLSLPEGSSEGQLHLPTYPSPLPPPPPPHSLGLPPLQAQPLTLQDLPSPTGPHSFSNGVQGVRKGNFPQNFTPLKLPLKVILEHTIPKSIILF